MVKINLNALRTDSQDWRGQDGAKEYAEILGWTLEKLRQDGKVNLDELYSSVRPPKWGGEAPADIPLYRAFLHLTEVGAAQGNTVYMCDEMGEPLTHSHKDSTLTAGPNLPRVSRIVALHDHTGKCLYAETGQEEDPKKAAQQMLANLKEKKSFGTQVYLGPVPNRTHQIHITEVFNATKLHIVAAWDLLPKPEPKKDPEPEL
jgi:hypothetical protein